jgi:deazaflavin-dependent oxidoreductase (nitroreductase family)
MALADPPSGGHTQREGVQEVSRMRRVLVLGVALAGLVAGFAAWWRRHPRFGAQWVNRVADPWLVRQGIVSNSKGEIGLLEHVGRRSGTVRVTPVHPVRTPDGFRIIVPLGLESQWALNVLAAGHCRLQIDDVIHELDEPQWVQPADVEGLPAPAIQLMEWLGFRYLSLRQFAEAAGTFDAPAGTPDEATVDANPEDRTAVVEDALPAF